MAGAEGLEPSARGFGVDVETNHGKQGKAGVARFSRTSPKRKSQKSGAGLVLRGIFVSQTREKEQENQPRNSQRYGRVNKDKG